MLHLLRGTLVALVLAAAGSLASSPVEANERPRYSAIAAADVADLRDEQQVRVSVRQGTPNRGVVVGLIQAPAEELYRIVLDYPRIPEWSPALVRAAESGDTGATKVVEGETHLPWPLSNRTWRINVEYGPRTIDGTEAWVVAWDYQAGSGNINDTFGYWLVMPWPEDPSYSYVKYVLNADPNIALPDWLIRTITRRTLPDLVRNLRRRHAAGFGR